MAGRLQELAVIDPVLSNIAQGYLNSDFVGERLFPFTIVPKTRGKYVKFGREHFRVYNTRRAPRADVRRIDWGVASGDLTTQERALESAVDALEIKEATPPIRPEERAAMLVQKAILLEHEYDSSVLAQDAAKYQSANKVTLTGTGQWTDETNSNPISDITTAKEAIRQAIGAYPSSIVFGATAWNSFKKHPKVRAYLASDVLEVITPEMASRILEIPNVSVGRAVYENAAGTLADLWGDNVVLAWVPPQSERSVEVPSYGYTFRREGYPFVQQYAHPRSNSEVVQNFDNFEAYITADNGMAGYLIKDTNA